MEISQLHKLFLESSGASTDTRKIFPNSIFFALKGPTFNGNEFAATALKKGASYTVIDERQEEMDDRFIMVGDVLKTLQDLARYHRTYLGLLIIALTGSNGKTTTKELMKAVLAKKFKTVATSGNLNNHIGVPLTLLSMTRETEVGIVEMGANHQKEIESLANIALPDIGYITNFGKAHLEGFGGFEGVVAGKSELYDHLKRHNKTILLNIDDPIQKEKGQTEKTFSFGNSKEADFNITYPKAGEYAQIKTGNIVVGSNLIGDYNARNMAAALALGVYLKVPLEKYKEAIETYIPNNNRSQIIEKDSNKIILDAYNANPTSMAAAVENFENRKEAPKVAVLGDMFELGAVSEEEHQQLVNRLKASKIDHIYLIGEHFHKTETGNKILKFKTFNNFKQSFQPNSIKNALILIKGSRGMALERVLEIL